MNAGPNKIPDLSTCLKAVEMRVAARDRTRQRRHNASLAVARPDQFPQAIESLRANHAALIARAHERGAAWVPLQDAELILLEHQTNIFEGERQLEVLEDIGVHDEDTKRALATLRVNIVMGQTLVKGDLFRECTRQLVTEAIAHFDCPFPLTREKRVIIPIWRAGLIMAEGYERMGFRRFGHVGLRRQEDTPNVQDVYHLDLSKIGSDDVIHLVDPMLATGGSILKTLEVLAQKGVTPQTHEILVHVLIAAPEGIDAILSHHPQVRIVAHARDGHLNHLAYIEDVGLGDAGDQLMDGVDMTYAREHWVGTGIMSFKDTEIILERTQRRVAELAQIAWPAS